MWITGVEMVENGVDHLSWEGAFDPHEATLTPAAWTIVSDLAHSCGWKLEVDWFADEHIAMLPTFWTQSPCGAAEGTDTLQAPSWVTHHCQHCKEQRGCSPLCLCSIASPSTHCETKHTG